VSGELAVEQGTEGPSDVYSDTTGSSFHPPDVVSISSSDDGDHDVETAESPEFNGEETYKTAKSPVSIYWGAEM
jgi:hypothetical protein